MSVTGRDSIETQKPEWLTQMENALEVLNEGVIIADDSHRILFANSRFVDMTGIPRHQKAANVTHENFSSLTSE